MNNLEHLIENGLITMTRCHGYDDWHSHIADDPNWDGVWISIEDLWTICQYVVYVWDAVRCEECRGNDCSGCKNMNSDKCIDCKRRWADKKDYYEMNLYTDTFGTAEEIKDYVEEVIDAPESADEWDRLWRCAERDRV